MNLMQSKGKAPALPKFNESLPPQQRLEDYIFQAIEQGYYENAFLFSEDGLLLAGDNTEDRETQDSLIELAGFLRDVKSVSETVGNIEQLKEIIIEGENYKKIVFRFFRSFDQMVAFVAIVPERKSYRKVTNQFIRAVDKLSWD